MARGSSPDDFLFEAVDPEDAINFFEAKGFTVGFDWRDVWQDEHARGFTVAKAMTVDLLTDIREVVDKAIADGIAFEDFRDNLEPVLRARGWWGRAIMEDPLTGQTRDVQLGSYRRLQTIYDTNLRTSYSAGTWHQIQRTKEQLPYLRYVDPSANPRPEHLSWSGTIVRADDPWWQTHYPPNGWHCHCYADSLGEKDLERDYPDVTPIAPPSPEYAYVNPRTGDVTMIPRGIEPGFGHNPGVAGIQFAAENALKDKLAQADKDLAEAAEKRWPARPAGNPTLDEAIAHGHRIAEVLPLPSADEPHEIATWRERLLDKLKQERGAGGVELAFGRGGGGKGAELLREAAGKYPDAWIRKSNETGRVIPQFSRARGFHRRLQTDARGHFDSIIKLDDVTTAVHELGHRLQATMPGLDAYFRQLHARRTAGEPLVQLKHLRPRAGYRASEVTRQDKYVNPYFGKEYSDGPKEVLTMTFQGLLHGGIRDGDSALIRDLLTKDPELLNLAIGLLFTYEP